MLKSLVITWVLLLAFYTPPAFCEDKQITFEKNLRYDIYYSVNGYEVNTIRSVQILGVEKLVGKSFLVVTTGDFNSQDKKGYVAVDDLTAIIPSHYFNPVEVPAVYYKNLPAIYPPVPLIEEKK